MGAQNFVVIIPARLASTRLPNKPLADIAGKPMVVRVAERAALSGATSVAVACDDERIMSACQAHGVAAFMTRADHPSGTDRIAETALQLELPDDAIIVNVQGDEPLIDPHLIAATAAQVTRATPMATAAHPIREIDDVFNPNVVKVVIDKTNRALYFSRAAIPWHRDAFAQTPNVLPPDYCIYRHIGLYAYTHAFLKRYASLETAPIERYEALEQLRVLWNGYPIAVQITQDAPSAGVDTLEDLDRVRGRVG
jgi:3-deoxy-manno-octulosonate cytidylyltransferase (CMP-KDO synthetase)